MVKRSVEDVIKGIMTIMVNGAMDVDEGRLIPFIYDNGYTNCVIDYDKNEKRDTDKGEPFADEDYRLTPYFIKSY